MTAVGVCEAPPGTAAWLQARRAGIGASEISALTGTSPWASPLSVWLSKTGEEEEGEETEAMRWGQRLEPVVIAAHVADYPGVVVETAPTDFASILAVEDKPIIRASLDGVRQDKNRTEVLEVKTSRSAQGWDDGQAPPQYVEQVQWQLCVTGLAVGRIVALIGGNRVEERIVHAHHAWQTRAADMAAEWWETHIVGDLMPSPTRRDTAVMPRLWTPNLDETVELPADVWDVYTAADLAAKEAAAKLAEAKIRVQEAMGEATTAQVAGATVATWKATKSRTIWDGKRLAEVHPNLIGEFSKQGEPGRTFRPSKRKESA